VVVSSVLSNEAASSVLSSSKEPFDLKDSESSSVSKDWNDAEFHVEDLPSARYLFSLFSTIENVV